MRRAFFQDGHGRKLLSLAFVRHRDGTADLTVDFARPRESWLPERAAIFTPIPLDLWERAVRATADLRPIPRRPSSPKPGEPDVEPGDVLVCVHGSLWGIEIAEGRSPIRRTVRESCDDERVPAVGNELARLAVSVFPACRALERDREYPAGLLDGCGLLSGNRMAAASVLNAIQDAGLDRRFHGGPERLAALLADGVTLDWDGARARGRAAASMLMARKLDENHVSWLTISGVEGLADGRVRVSGFVVRYPDDPAGQRVRHIASFGMVWVRDGSGPLLVAEAEAGPSAPQPDPR